MTEFTLHPPDAPTPLPMLSDEEWTVIEDFLGCKIRNREAAAHAFWEDTYAHEHNKRDNFKRLAWLGDRVLNLALADRRDAESEPMKRWNGTDYQTIEQSETAAASVWWVWPAPVCALLRLGKSKQGLANNRIVATFVEAIIGVVFRERGYVVAREFVYRHWPIAG